VFGGHLPDPRFEFGKSLWRDAPLAAVIGNAKTQELRDWSVPSIVKMICGGWLRLS
jgi:hypothetical protein